ncbi:outer-membrane lipoprotein carrier protein LolA [Phenylobacterium sp. LjRoot219]|uniref:LolA family protein n=1 Tax=Phenylobacterium sp. LjRoot219 TaxID=3342283 RepID=UPI003ECC1C80
MSTSRRSFVLAIAAGAVAGPALAQPQAPALAPADKALVDKAVAYLEGLTEAKARFVQTAPGGQVSRGVVYLKRPGKARFAYDPPSGLLVVSDGGNVSVADSRLKTFDKYPLVATPLSLFLAKNIRFDRGVQVTGVTRAADGFTISARDGRKQTAGQIALTFRNDPLTLVGWAVTDAQRRVTRVQLLDLAPVSGLDSRLFSLRDPRQGLGRGKM